MERMSGYSRLNLEHTMSWTSFVSPEDLTRMYEYHQKRRKGVVDIPSQYEFTFVSRDNRRIRSFITVGMIPGTKKSIVSIIDISRLSDTEHALRESEEKFRKLAESLSLGVYIIQDEKFLYANPYIVSLLGYSIEELYALPLLSFFIEEDIPIIKKSMEDRLTKKVSSVVYNVHAKTKKNEIMLIEIQGSVTFYRSKPAFIGVFKKIEVEYD
jgi:PAS domain S-box-containing protein